MPFYHGKDTKVYISGYDLTTYFNSFTTTATADLADTSTFGNVYKSFVAGLLDAKMTFEGFFDPTAGAIEPVLTAKLAQDAYLVQLPAGDVQGARGRAMYGVETTLDIGTSIDGAATISAEASSKTGAEPVTVNCIKGAKSSSGNDASGVNSGYVGGTAFGWSAYLQVFAVSGSSATLDVVLQDSADNSTFLDVSGGNFTQVLQAGVPTAQRISGTGTLRQYTRFKWTLGGSTPNFTIWGGHVRKVA